MIFRVSEVEMFRQWRDDEEAELEMLLARFRGQVEPSPQMAAGSAFHRALELSADGEAVELSADGYRFLIECDAILELPEVREIRSSKAYGDVIVSGCVDCIHALRIDDHKTTARFDPDRYIGGYQWRYYLDIFGARIFRWNVFEMREIEERVYSVYGVHQLEQYAYPSMHEDCARLAADLGAFAAEHLPERLKAA